LFEVENSKMANSPNNRVWTAMERDMFIEKATHSTTRKGYDGAYEFTVLPKITVHAENEDDRRAKVTKVLMHTVFSKPQYRIIAMKVYELLWAKIYANPFTRLHANKNIMVVLKGGTAYTFVVRMEDADVFPFSDLDIVVAINPYLPRQLFEDLKAAVNIAVLQTISQYKRTLDHMFFLNKDIENPILGNKDIEEFKKDLSAALATLDDEDGMYVSPCDDIYARNRVSKNSFILADNKVQPDTVVKVEVPHFESCDRIPLRKTPLFCSHNRSISFNRTPAANTNSVGCFDLYRMRWNVLYRRCDVDVGSTSDSGSIHSDSDASSNASFSLNNTTATASASKPLKPYEYITADFVDISILAQNDAELKDFWNHGKVMNVLDRALGSWVMIPDLVTMLRDLHKMLHVYECNESKRGKRQEKYNRLKRYVGYVY
jgi:hypothetical protein